MENFDPAGNSPGLVGTLVPSPKQHHMKCRNMDCMSLLAIEITPPVNRENAGAPHHRTYQCVKCKSTWTLSVGGFVSL
jgi:hypothetical protein